MTVFKTLSAATVAVVLTGGAAVAQTTSQDTTQQDRVGAILGALFGDRLGVSTSIESQWAAGRKPLQTQRTQFNTRIDADVRSGALSSTNGARMKAEYDELVALETRYGADGRFTTAERTELGDRYGALTQALTDGGYATPGGSASGSNALTVAAGRSDFDRRVDAQVTARRLSRTDATHLKADYSALITVEAGYARDGISTRERDDLDTRLDALDARVGDVQSGGGYQPVLDNRTRLSNIESALSTGERSGAINRTEAADIRVELGDLTRLEAAYARTSPSRDDTDYLARRLGELEVRARVNIRR